jgi:hypothetical protein
MRQRRWLELIKDYDLTINYTPGKANVVADTLSRKSTDTQPMSRELPKELLMDLERLEIQCLEVESLGSFSTMKVMEERQSDLKYTIFHRQSEDPFIEEEIRRIEEGRPSEFCLGDFNLLWFNNRICVPDISQIKQLILKEAHETPYSIHPRSTKMYMDLKELFWWNNMKREIAKFMSECHTCQRVKVEHQSRWTHATVGYTRVEMGRDWNRFYHRVTIDTKEEGYDLGYHGQVNQKCTFLGR